MSRVIRSIATTLVAGLFCILAFAAFDREWPDFSPLGWLVFVAGLVAIAVVPIPLESMYEARKRR